MNREKQSELMGVINKITSTMGRDVVKFAIQGKKKRWKLRQEKLSPCCITKWEDLLNIDMDK